MRKYFGQLAAFCFFLAAVSCFLTAAIAPLEERGTRVVVGCILAGLAGTIFFFEVSRRKVKKVESQVVTFNNPIKEETQTWTET